MIDYTQALERLLAQTDTLPAEICALGDAVGRVLAVDVASPIALPSFDHAAMDGYALNALPRLSAGSEHEIHGSHAAGEAMRDASRYADQPRACEIMTGASLPHGLNAVVALERTDCLATHSDGRPARIRLLDALQVGDNVRHAGSDVAQGAHALSAGQRVSSAQIMLLAALGKAAVDVVRRPRVAIIGTGKELQSDLLRPLGAGRIYHSNGPYLAAALSTAGAQVLSCETVDDTALSYCAALHRAIDAGADLVISTGAVSMGRHDFVPAALRDLDAQLLFHKVAIRPGKPLLAARLAEGPLVIALPGTPMAVAAGLRFFVVPVLRKMTGQGNEPVLHAVLDTAQQPKAGFRHFLRARLHQPADDRLHVTVPDPQQPFRIGPFADADVWVVLPEDAGSCPAGTRVQIVGVEPGWPPSLHRPH